MEKQSNPTVSKEFAKRLIMLMSLLNQTKLLEIVDAMPPQHVSRL